MISKCLKLFSVFLFFGFAVLPAIGKTETAEAKKKATESPAPEVGNLKLAAKALEKTSAKLRTVGFFSADVVKEVENSAIGITKKYKGQLLVSSGRFAFRSESPEKSLLLFDGAQIWNVIFKDDIEFEKVNELAPKKNQVAQISKAKVSRQNKSQLALADLLVGKAGLKKIKILSASLKEGVWQIKADAKELEATLTELSLEISEEDSLFKNIEYHDELGNRTSYKIEQQKMSDANKVRIRFTPPKGIEVIEL